MTSWWRSGGDGTVNEAANGLLGSSTPLSCLPGGSANVFAKLLGIPGDMLDATEHLLGLADDWRERRVDLGVVNGRCFTFNSGLGLDAMVVEQVDSNPHLKARLGPWYYSWVAVSTFLRRYLRRPAATARAHRGRTLDGVLAIIQNGATFTYFQDRPIDIADEVELDSGALAGGVLHRAGVVVDALDRVAGLLAAVPGWPPPPGHPAAGQLRELTVRTADGRPLPLQADGDFLGEVAEARYSILPDALNVVC